MPCNCDHTQLLISKYIDDEATIEERQVVEAHILFCRECARKLASYLEVAAIVSHAARRRSGLDFREDRLKSIDRLKKGGIVH